MAIAMTEEMSISLQKGLSEWWNEETEYVFQRIERWAAFARGYNRLRSQRLSKGRLTMQEEQEPRWSISSNKIVIEDPTWSPRFHNLKRSHRRKSRTDENCKINCCGTFNYQSNSNLDSTCLESYRYDHSIYFKTIGDIKSSKKDLSGSKSEADDEASCFSDEQLEWEANTSAPRFIDVHNFQDEDDRVAEIAMENGNVCLHVPKFEINIQDIDEPEDEVMDSVVHNVWPIVDLTKLSLNTSSDNEVANYRYDLDNETEDNSTVNEIQSNDNDNNNNNDYSNCNQESGDSTQKMIQLQISELANNQTRRNPTMNSLSPMKSNQEGITRILSLRKQRRSPKRVRQPTLAGDNNVTWPGVLLNYTKNVDSATSPHHHHAVHVK